ncbi:hypothetical protein DSO57_1018165 [Entomophthora muscae]|uniref:Uncharacterized protein n=1 Tax=Entomophthora muscae TaxID=34485 RepID=A0ACC2TF48_9FUNG|nr:hypothetical protein DSO57_1018165 [Entomophthora muscae]
MTSWTPLQSGLVEINSPLNPHALKTELESASLFYKNINIHMSFDYSNESEDSVEDSTSETYSDISSETSSKTISLYKTEILLLIHATRRLPLQRQV